MRFFQLLETANDDAWTVSIPPSQFVNQQVVWQFSEGRTLAMDDSIEVEIGSGAPTDFVLTGFSIPVVSGAFREIVESICPSEVQFFPTIGTDISRLWVMNVLASIECIDYEKSELQICANKGRAFRHRYGKPEMISRLAIKDIAPETGSIFRVKDWRTAIIVGNYLKEAIETAKLKGVAFTEA